MVRKHIIAISIMALMASTLVIVPATTVFAQGSDGVCIQTPRGPWSPSVDRDNLTEIEVQSTDNQSWAQDGDTAQHYWVRFDGADHPEVTYVTPGIAPEERSWKWDGYGTAWVSDDDPDCAGFDFYSDLARHAASRIESNHSGLAFDLRTSPPVLVANVCNLSVDQINSILEVQQAHQRGTVKFRVEDNVPTNQPPASINFVCPNGWNNGAQAIEPPATPMEEAPPIAEEPIVVDDSLSNFECKAYSEKHRFDVSPQQAKSWNFAKKAPKNAIVLANVWSNAVDPNWPSTGTAERKVWFDPNQRPSLKVGGSFFPMPAGCLSYAENNFAANPNDKISVGKLKTLQAKNFVR